MGPVNPGYSKQCESTRKLMEEHLTTRRWGCREVMDIFDQIYLLWNGILTENFVFNFKNSLYINAYDRLERKFKELTNHMKKIYDEWRSTKEVEVKKLEEKATRETILEVLQGDAPAQLKHVSHQKRQEKCRQQVADDLPHSLNQAL